MGLYSIHRQALAGKATDGWTNGMHLLRLGAEGELGTWWLVPSPWWSPPGEC